VGYHATVQIHWAPQCGDTEEHIFDSLWTMTSTRPKKTIASQCPLISSGEDNGGGSSSSTTAAIPRRLWMALCKAADVPPDLVWGQASKKVIRQLARQISACEVQVTGKGQFKEEFGTSWLETKKATPKKMHLSPCVLKYCSPLFPPHSYRRWCFIKRNQYENYAKQSMPRTIFVWRGN
jgi:predicted flavoprotein YhiN